MRTIGIIYLDAIIADGQVKTQLNSDSTYAAFPDKQDSN